MKICFGLAGNSRRAIIIIKSRKHIFLLDLTISFSAALACKRGSGWKTCTVQRDWVALSREQFLIEAEGGGGKKQQIKRKIYARKL